MKSIYLAQQQDSNLYKIGITKKEPKKRIKELQTGNGNPLVLIESFKTKHDFKMETALHAHFNTKKREGEWFELSEEDVKNFASLCNDKEATMDFLKKNNFFWEQY